jgi:ATP-binding cassette subfamily F protein uup
LILDEPTNDLDIDTLNVLEEFLENYPGVLVLVSHDRYLVDKLTDQLFILEGNGEIRIYNGNYSSYRFEQDQIKSKIKEAKTSLVVEVKKESTKPKLSYKEQKELQGLEIEIEVIEKQIEDLTIRLNDTKASHEDLISLSQEIKDQNRLLEDKSFRWIELSEIA